MKCILAVTHDSLSKELIGAFEKRRFIKVGQGIFVIAGCRIGPDGCGEFDLEDAPAGVRPGEVAVTVPFGTPQAVIRSSEWNGEGLPPVGLTVEVLWSSQERTYVTGKVLAHDEGQAVFRFTSGQRKGEIQAERVSTYNNGELSNFRPMCTAEQLARDAHRAKYWPQLVELWEADTKREDFLEAVYAIIAEADKS